jgi:Ca-activated chloride channel family protein
MVLGVPLETIRPEVVALALEHQLVTRFTSLVAVDRTPVRPRADPLRSDGTSGPSAGFPATATGAPAEVRLGLAVLGLALALALLGRGRRVSVPGRARAGAGG